MIFFELEATDISSLDDGDLRELVARLCEAELVQQGVQPSSVKWGGAQEAPDGGLDVSVRSAAGIADPNFVPRDSTGFQVKKHSMSKSACRKEMEEHGKPKAIIEHLASRRGAYIIVSGKDDCSEKMLSERLDGMKAAVNALQGKDDLHLDFYGRDRLSNWLRRHPSVALWVRSRLGKPLAGWKPYGRWAATPPDQDDELLVDDHPCVIDENSSSKDPIPASEGIQLTRDRLRKFGSTVRITGLSGVGKTRFVQALFEANLGLDALPQSEVIYADLGNDLTPTASELATYLIAHDFATYLVLDNCPPDVHRSLQKQVAGSSTKLRLLTIEYDISEDKPEGTEVIHLEPTSDKTISKLVQKRFPDLGPVNAERIAEFAGGNARMAMALASRVNADETLSNFSDDHLFRRLFSQRKGESPELLRSAEALALVYSFNVSRIEFNDELSVLGTIASLNRQALHRDHAELLRRQLAQKRGNWRAILPHALANRLARRALQNIPLEDINAELFKSENLRLFQSCAHRLGYLHDFALARELARTWTRPGAPLGNIANCSDKYLVALDHVAPVFPDVVLRAIEQASTVPGFASRENRHFIRFVRLLCHLAYEDETFDRAAEVLLKFAETERTGENNNSIVSQMRQLFSLRLSGTEALPKRRQAFVHRLLNSPTSRHREIATELLRSAFEANHWTSFGTFHFGARKRGLGWEPRTHDERIAWYAGHLQLLKPLLGSAQQKDRDWAKSLLASHFRGLWTFAGCFDSVEQIIRDHGRDGNWPEMWTSINKTLRFDGERHPPELLTRLESLEKLTAPSNTYSEIEAYALTDTGNHVALFGENRQEKTNEIHEKVIKLGELTAASELQYLDRLGAKLWSTCAQPILWFGTGLSAGAADKLLMFDRLVNSLQKHRSELTNIRLLEGFLSGTHNSNPEQARQILENALEIPELKVHAVSLLTAAPITPWASRKLLELAQSRELEAWRFKELSYSRAHEAIPDSELAALLTEINALDKGYVSTIEILFMRVLGKDAHEHTLSDELRTAARGAIFRLVSAHRDEISQSQPHGIDRVLDLAFSTTAPESEIIEIINLLCEGIGTYRFYTHEMIEVIVALTKRYSRLLLDAIFDGSENESTLAFLIFRDRLNREPTLNGAPLGEVIAWCGNDQERIKKAAMALGAFCTDDPNDPTDENPKQIALSEHIKSLLNVTTDKSALVEIIFEDISPSSWSGSLADILELRSKAFAKLLEYPNPEVQALARIKMPLIEQRIHGERAREAANHNEREQRFE